MMDLPPPYIDLVRDSAELYFGVPAPVPVILGQIAQESGGNPKAVSKAGAVGLMQFMPSTWKWYAETNGYGVGVSPLNPADAIRAGVWYDRFLYNRVIYSSTCHRWGAALSSFNGGLGWHNKRRERAENPDDFWNSVRFINPGITKDNQGENSWYPYRIVYHHQVKYKQFGPLVCKGGT